MQQRDPPEGGPLPKEKSIKASRRKAVVMQVVETESARQRDARGDGLSSLGSRHSGVINNGYVQRRKPSRKGPTYDDRGERQ